MIIVLVSHGDYAKSAKRSLEMITGEINNMFPIGLYENMGKDDLKKEIQIILNEHKNEEFILLSDLYGGTPSNVTVELGLQDDRIHVVSGFNMGMLLDIVTSDCENIDEIIRKIHSGISRYIKFPGEYLEVDLQCAESADL